VKLKVEDNQNPVKVEVKILPTHLKHIFLDEYHKKKLCGLEMVVFKFKNNINEDN